MRRARAGDLEHAAPLFDAYRQFYGAAPDLAAARTFLAARMAREDSIVLLAFAALATPSDEETALGFAQLYPSLSSISLGPVTILNDLYVSPAGRRAGVARRLVEEAAAHARRTGAIRLELATQHTNLAALELYRSLGFEPETEFAHLSLELHR